MIKITNEKTVNEVIEPQIKGLIAAGVTDPFQAGYAEAICWTWNQAGLPFTEDVSALRKMVVDFIVHWDEKKAA
jgi:hypothetical protein